MRHQQATGCVLTALRVAIDHHARMATAQDLYKRMLREDVAPALRHLGMKGSAGNFALPDPDHYLLVGFQSSRSNTAEAVRFTVNLAVISKNAWKQGWQSWWGKPSATAQGPVGTYVRLGELMPVHDDVWWELAPDTDPAGLAAEVVRAIEQFGLRGLMQLRSGD
jgi:hypothetical protein